MPGDGLRSRRLSGTRHRSRAAGFTLVEILIAAAVIGLGLVGVAAGFLHAVGGLEAGRQQTTAAFLNYPSEGYGSVSSNGNPMPSYRRTVTIVDAPDGLGRTKLVEVTVSYRPVVGFGVLAAERQVRLSALLTDRT